MPYGNVKEHTRNVKELSWMIFIDSVDMVQLGFDPTGYIHIGIVILSYEWHKGMLKNYLRKGKELPWVIFLDFADMVQLGFDPLGKIHIGIVILSYEYHRGMVKNYIRKAGPWYALTNNSRKYCCKKFTFL